MRLLAFTLLLTLVAGGATAAAGHSAHAAGTLCVGSKPGCFSTIQAAVNAARDGDTIKIAPGTFAGGVTINVSVNVIGAGSSKTIIKGGGPVLTIGRQEAPTEPTVSIRGVTITGGLNNSQPDTVVSLGGGVWIPFAAGFTTGATVTIADSIITGNRVTPQTTASFCGAPACAFAFGGGIDNAGALTVTNTRISDNEAGSTPTLSSVTSGAGAGGIFNEGLGTLTLRHSFVTGNRAAVNAPNGAFAQAGGIGSAGALTIEDSVVSANRVDASNVGGEVDAFAGGILAQGPLTLSDSAVEHNHVSASLSSSSGGFMFTDAGGVEVDGVATITNTRIVANSLEASAPAGTVIAVGGGLAVGFHNGVTVRNSLIARNTVAAASAGGTPIGAGGGVENNGVLTLKRTLVVGNSAVATGPSGIVHGGGISNETFPGDSPPILTLTDSVIAANRLSASPGVTPQGGGLFTDSPVTMTRTVIAGNQPDQCFGC
jgi:hypothetical protein